VAGPLLFLFLIVCHVYLLVVSGSVSYVASCCPFPVLGRNCCFCYCFCCCTKCCCTSGSSNEATFGALAMIQTAVLLGMTP
jgi:hypothetical protein